MNSPARELAVITGASSELKVVAGAANKMRAAMTNVLPDKTLPKMHTGKSAPGTAKQSAEKAKSRQQRSDLPRP